MYKQSAKKDQLWQSHLGDTNLKVSDTDTNTCSKKVSGTFDNERNTIKGCIDN